LGRDFVRTIRHFWPAFSNWLRRLPDSRRQEFVVYDRAFLARWGIALFVFKVGSRRQLDFELRDLDTAVLENLNHLAGAAQETLPVHDTLNHFLSHVGPDAFRELRTRMVRRLIRMKALESSRLLGRVVIAVDGTGHLAFRRRHCKHCLVQKHGDRRYYLHPVLEAKLITPDGLALSIGSVFIENPGADHRTKQDCELEAFKRLAAQLKADFPQLRICIVADALYACGSVIQICEDNRWAYVFTFKEGSLPAVWDEFQRLMPLAPENRLILLTPHNARQTHRWVNSLTYTDDANRSHTFTAIQCHETASDNTNRFAWITNLRTTDRTVIQIAAKGGRQRWKIENESFNMQKNGGYNLEHAYSFRLDNLKAFYYLLQIAHIMMQLIEKGSLLRHLAGRTGKTVMQLFGSLKNIARRLLECFRYKVIPLRAYDTLAAASIQIRLDSS